MLITNFKHTEGSDRSSYDNEPIWWLEGSNEERNSDKENSDKSLPSALSQNSKKG